MSAVSDTVGLITVICSDDRKATGVLKEMLGLTELRSYTSFCLERNKFTTTQDFMNSLAKHSSKIGVVFDLTTDQEVWGDPWVELAPSDAWLFYNAGLTVKYSEGTLDILKCRAASDVASIQFKSAFYDEFNKQNPIEK